MGRRSTGILTTRECQRIEITHLIKNGYFSKSISRNGTYSWSNGNTIGYYLELSEKGHYIRLVYTNTNYAGEKMIWIILFSLFQFQAIWEGGKSGILFVLLLIENAGYFIRPMEAYISKAGKHIKPEYIIQARLAVKGIYVLIESIPLIGN